MKILKKTGQGFFFALVLCFLATQPAQAQTTETQTLNLDIPSLVRVLNEDRLAAGLHPLRRDPALDKAAALKAADMVRNGYFAHTSPQGVDPWFWFKQADYDYIYAGENLALDFTDPKAVQTAWMKSPKHRDNILNEDYEDVGYAIAAGTFTNINGDAKTRQGIIIVQLFGKRMPAVATSLAGLKQEPKPIASPATKAYEQIHKPLMQRIAAVAEKAALDVMAGTEVAYTTSATSDNLGAKVANAATSNREPAPWATWPTVSLGFAVLMFTAGLHGRFVV